VANNPSLEAVAQTQDTRERIRRCALGYRTAAIMQAELPRRTDNPFGAGKIEAKAVIQFIQNIFRYRA